MKNLIKLSIALVLFSAMLGSSLQTTAYPTYLRPALKFGAKNCLFCHTRAQGGEGWNARGQWLIDEKERRKADDIDVEWLAEYKEGGVTDAAKKEADKAEKKETEKKEAENKEAENKEADKKETENREADKKEADKGDKAEPKTGESHHHEGQGDHHGKPEGDQKEGDQSDPKAGQKAPPGKTKKTPKAQRKNPVQPDNSTE